MTPLDVQLLRGPGADAVLGWEGGWITRAELLAAVEGWCVELARQGVAAGDRVLLVAARGPAWVAAHVACLRHGAVTVPVNPALTATELDHVLADSEPALVLHDGAGAEFLAHSGVQRLLSLDVPPAPGRVPPPAARSAADLAVLLYTSGTTGQPKGVMLSHGSLAATTEALGSAWQLSANDRLLHVLPLFHVHGLLVALHACLAAGASVQLLPRFEPQAVWQALERNGITIFMGVPTLYHRLLQACAEHPRPLPRLRLFTCGSAPLPASRLDAWEAATGHRILERYGLSEAGMVCGNRLHGQRHAGTVGFDLPGVSTRLVDAHTGGPVQAGLEGEIQVRSTQLFSGYRGRPEATAAAFSADGWFRTGDLGRRNEAGALVISGRLKELIITGGLNVHPGEVEALLLQLPWVSEAGVVGLPDTDLGERVVAALVPRAGATPDLEGALAFCRQRLTLSKCPRQALLVEQLPRNALGKLQRAALAATLAATLKRA